VLKRLWLLIGLLAGTPLLHAQSEPTASRLGDLQIGVGYGLADPDYTPEKFKGIAAYADFDFTSHLGAEFDFRLLQDSTPQDFYEKTYEVGVRYHRNYGRLSPYGKIMVGRGVFNYQYGIANLAYNMFAIGGGADYHINRSINVRADFEYQHWTGFPPSGLTPIVGTLGVAYRFH
jgi:hypothetical protein